MAEAVEACQENTTLVDAATIVGSSSQPYIDVRSPSEYQAGHIPGAYNVPLFSDEERAVVGTLYKQVGRQAALDKGLEFVGPKIASLVKQIRAHGGPAPVIYCWRGGMRSDSVCGLMKISGVDCRRLAGGYKAYRRYIRQAFSRPAPLILLGGYTGSGKTDLLHRLARDKYQILDLEGLANHKGSAFGHLNEDPQPTNEQFENNLFDKFTACDLSQPIIVENESRVIGKVHLPEPFFMQMRSAPLLALSMPTEARISRLIGDYADTPKDELIEATRRIAKKLGHDKVKMVEDHIHDGHFDKACAILLSYYDIFYDRGVFKRPKELIHPLQISGNDMEGDIALIKEKIRSISELATKESFGHA